MSNYLKQIFTLLLLSLLFINTQKVSATTPSAISIADSVKLKNYNEFYETSLFTAPDSVIKLTDLHFHLAEKHDSKVEMIKALDKKAYALAMTGKMSTSIAPIKKAIAIAEDMDDPILLGKKNSNLGSIYFLLQDFKKSYKYYDKSKRIFEAENSDLLGEALNNLGMIHLELGSYEMAIRFFKKANAIFEQKKDTQRIGIVKINIGKALVNVGQPEKAIQVLREGFREADMKKEDPNKSLFYINTALAFKDLEKLDSALYYGHKSLEANKTIGNKTLILDDKLLIADLQLKTDIKKVVPISNEILELTQSSTIISQKMRAYELLSKFHKTQGNYEVALQMQEQHLLYRDSFEKEETKVLMMKNAIIDEYENKSKKKTTKLKNKHFRTQVILGIFSLGLIALILFRTKKKSNAQKNEINQLLSKIEKLKAQNNKTTLVSSTVKFELNRSKLEKTINKKLNETDWNVLNILLDDPVISNKEIAKKAYLTIDGIGSSLRRMYVYFDIKESRYKKTSLILEAIKISNGAKASVSH